ncbi:MAG: hypothetical protein Q8Q14_01420 [Gemmatimonadales bacterium]|nr:hypothetical protein [Gemmatimonadales bacterium]
MPWTDAQKLNYLIKLPWTIVPDRTPEGERLLRVAELPAVVACGDTNEALEADFWAALEAALRSYLHFGDPLPLPAQRPALPWETAEDVPTKFAVRMVHGRQQNVTDADTRSDGEWKEMLRPEPDLVEA